MALYSKFDVFNTITEQRLMPLFYHNDIEVSKKILKACYLGGARLLEFTNRGDFAHQVFDELNKFARKELKGMMLGVGSIVDAPTAALYLQLGANFIVSASLREDVARCCNRRQVPYLPGCGSLTEIGRAEELGCEMVKLFPGNVYGPNFIKSVIAPQPWTKIMPTGGVNPSEENMSSWFDAGAVCVGMGSKLLSKELLAEGKYEQIADMVRQTLAKIQEITA